MASWRGRPQPPEIPKNTSIQAEGEETWKNKTDFNVSSSVLWSITVLFEFKQKHHAWEVKSGKHET